jgi:hypothetical protein
MKDYRDRFKKTVKYVIDAFDLEGLVCEAYSLSDFNAILESPNDCVHSYAVTDDPLEPWDQNILLEAISNQDINYYNVKVILNDLCRRGAIDPGEYLMEVCW